MPTDFLRVYELAEVAEAVLRRTSKSPGVADLSARALGYMANALRTQGNPNDAHRLFQGARQVIRNEGVTDPHICAEVDWFEGALLMDQRRFRESEELLTRAITLYTLAGDKTQAARPMLTLGTLYYNRGDVGKAAELTQTALDVMPPGEDPRFLLYARHNLTWYLVEAGYWSAAAKILTEDRTHYQEFPDAYTQLRLIWLEGKIAFGLGRRKDAETAFRTTREGFVREGSGYDAAMVSLDLALLYVEDGRAAELKQLAFDMHHIFSAEDVHREAAAALLLFETAVRQETITAEVVRDLSTYLKAARSNPTLQFRKPS
jgi:tetratricopeptide (TPR) repeat protein